MFPFSYSNSISNYINMFIIFMCVPLKMLWFTYLNNVELDIPCCFLLSSCFLQGDYSMYWFCCIILSTLHSKHILPIYTPKDKHSCWQFTAIKNNTSVNTLVCILFWNYVTISWSMKWANYYATGWGVQFTWLSSARLLLR